MAAVDPAGYTPGTSIGGEYAIVRELAAGGMGVLYVARHKTLDYSCAIKVMFPNLLADPKLREKFIQEAKLGAKIQSDHVVRVLAAGIDDTRGGLPWFAMELLDGVDLFELVDKRGAQPTAFVRDLFGQIGHGVGAAHDAGIVHRDLKPKNVFLAKAASVGGGQIVKVLDFGIAKVVADATLAGSMTVGSPYWMAPEQGALGQTITPATDVWALGLVAFYVLTGKIFWTSAVTARDKPFAILLEIQSTPIPSASERARALGATAALPAGFDAWFGRCVVRDPARRFRHAREACSTLVALLPGAAPTPPATSAGPMGTVMIDPSAVAAARRAAEHQQQTPHITTIHATPESAATLPLEDVLQHMTMPMATPGRSPPSLSSLEETRKIRRKSGPNWIVWLVIGVAALGVSAVVVWLFALR
ncbi:MAG: serine/threonine-protein kinase [Polyangiaceae bacterium]